MTITIIIAIVVLIVLYIIKLQRGLVGLSERRLNALSNIGVQQQSRWDALGQLAKVTKGYAKHESETLEKVVLARKGMTPTTAEEANDNESAFQDAMANFNVVVEQYPELKAQPLYQKLMTSLNEYEQNVRLARMVYNDATTMLNSRVRMFPANLVAGMIGFKAEEYIKTPESKTEMPDLDI